MHSIISVAPDSVGERLGIMPGDALVSINGEPIHDQIDYLYLTSDSDVSLLLTREGHEYRVHWRGVYCNLGLTFGDSMSVKPRECVNKCVFCFVDQLPSGMRESLYVKDDDWRMSLMMGNYITLTNISEAEFRRIISRKASPLYISIHAMDDDINAYMLGVTRAAEGEPHPAATRHPSAGGELLGCRGGILLPVRSIEERLNRLRDAGISFHCQIVLCPGINDGNILDDTIDRIAGGKLPPLRGNAAGAQSIAIVPVGLTKYRVGLPHIEPVNEECARAVITSVQAWQAKFLTRFGTRFVFASDEMYIKAGMPLPSYGEYEDFQQIGNGVGLIADFTYEFEAEMDNANGSVGLKTAIVTGVDAVPYIESLVSKYNIDTIPIVNSFFGETVTVTGLVTAQDIAEQFCSISDAYDVILIPDCMLNDDMVFLDDWSVDDLREKLHTEVRVVETRGDALAREIRGLCVGRDALIAPIADNEECNGKQN